MVDWQFNYDLNYPRNLHLLINDMLSALTGRCENDSGFNILKTFIIPV